jgi:hypothetical protein
MATKLAQRVAVITVLLFAATTPSYAYLDPGTASIVLQSIVAAFAAGAATIGIYWNRVKGIFRPRGSGSKDLGPKD